MISNTIPNVIYVVIDYHSAVRGRQSPKLTLIKNAGMAHVSESNITVKGRPRQFVSGAYPTLIIVRLCLYDLLPLI